VDTEQKQKGKTITEQKKKNESLEVRSGKGKLNNLAL
jgi:hypothetical protein